jgi:hypothetical protein
MRGTNPRPESGPAGTIRANAVRHSGRWAKAVLSAAALGVISFCWSTDFVLLVLVRTWDQSWTADPHLRSWFEVASVIVGLIVASLLMGMLLRELRGRERYAGAAVSSPSSGRPPAISDWGCWLPRGLRSP